VAFNPQNIMKTSFKPLYRFLFVSLAVVGCTSDFDEMNTNPNEPERVPTAYLLTQAQRSARAEQQLFGTNLYAQLFAETQYTGTSRYDLEQLSFDTYYNGPLADLQEIIDMNTNPETKDLAEVVNYGSHENQLAVARILKAYLVQIITDQWGDVPYTDALKGTANFAPAYTPQSEIYADLVKELKEATAQIDVTGEIQGDVIYGGDMGLWKKFGYSLLLRVGIRMSQVPEVQNLALDAINTALAAPDNVFQSNEESAVFKYLGEAINSNPIYYHFHVDNRTDYAISNTLVDFMLAQDDPRLAVYANPTETSVAAGTPEYVGELYGVTDDIAGETENADISFIGDYWKENASAPLIFQSYSEVLFIKAELAARGWAGLSEAQAAGFYNDAIEASMNYYGITDTDVIDEFISQPGVAYDQANWQQLIGEQKWLSLYAVGHEPWSEWRRLGYPLLERAPNATEDREIPLRRTYDTREFTLNRDNVDDAVARQTNGGTLAMSTPVWWDR
jgi:hypothetical protein